MSEQKYVIYPCDCNNCKNYWADSTADVIDSYKENNIELVLVYNSKTHTKAMQLFKTVLLTKEQYDQIKENVSG